MDEEAVTNLEDLQKRCRFCLKPQLDMRLLQPDDMSDIPKMFETLTDTQMELSPFYSSLVCAICENHMNMYCQIRLEFIRIAQLWRSVLAKQDIMSSSEDGILCKVELIDMVDKPKVDPNDSCKENEHKETPQISTEIIDNDYHDEDASSDGSDDEKTFQAVKRSRGRPRKNEVTVLICDICGGEVNSRKLLLLHMSTVHGSQKLPRSSTNTTTCHICGKTNLKRMAQHMRDHRKEDKFKCQHCPRSFNRHGMMVQHERQHTGERPFICDTCGFSFTSSAALNRHCKMHSLPASNNKTYQKVQQINRLRPVRTQPIPKLPPHQGIRPECPLCHNTYVNRVSIQRHMKLQHGAEGLVAWKQMLETTCMVCNEKFPTNEELKRHKPIHIEHQCPICRRRFHSKITLDLHVQGHSKKARPFKCELCEATYPCAFTLKIHFRRAHTVERPYKCCHCGHGFVERSVLNAHMRKVHSIHGQLKPHTCSMCPESFKSRDALRSHTEKHTGQYRYLCKLCQRNLHSGPQLAEHERIYHPEKINSVV